MLITSHAKTRQWAGTNHDSNANVDRASTVVMGTPQLNNLVVKKGGMSQRVYHSVQKSIK